MRGAMIILGAMVVLGVWASEAGAQAPCQHVPWNTSVASPHASTEWRTVRGRACPATVNGPSVRDMQVSEQPHNGQVRVENRTFTYTPAAGFTGSDTFRVRWLWTGDRGQAITSTLLINVTVSP